MNIEFEATIRVTVKADTIGAAREAAKVFADHISDLNVIQGKGGSKVSAFDIDVELVDTSSCDVCGDGMWDDEVRIIPDEMTVCPRCEASYIADPVAFDKMRDEVNDNPFDDDDDDDDEDEDSEDSENNEEDHDH